MEAQADDVCTEMGDDGNFCSGNWQTTVGDVVPSIRYHTGS